MSSLRRHEGYLMIDHRNSPGMPKSSDPAQVPGGQLWESPTVTCSHCSAVIILNPERSRPRHYCAKCDHYVCDKPGCIVECSPIRQKFERLYDQAVRNIALGG